MGFKCMLSNLVASRLSGSVTKKKEWSDKEIRNLKRAISRSKTSSDKTTHWEDIANRVGRSKRECYDMYKLLKASKKSKKKSKKKASTKVPGSGKEIEGELQRSKPEDSEQISTTHQETLKNITGTQEITVKPLQVKQCGWTSAPLSKETFKTTKKSDIKKKIALSSTSSTTSFETFMKSLDNTHNERKNTSSAKKTTLSSAQDTIVETNIGFEDLDDFDIVDDKSTTSAKTFVDADVQGVPDKIAKELHEIFFGKEKKKAFPKAWLEQGFHFSKCPDLGFGLVQNDGGPCGPLAVVQAFVLDFFLFHEKIREWQNPSNKDRSAALRYALCTYVRTQNQSFVSLTKRKKITKHSYDSVASWYKSWTMRCCH